MRKKIFGAFTLFLTVVMMLTTLSGCKGTSTSNSTTKKVRLNEVVRSVFYAPMYAAINKGFFKEEGIDIDLTTGQGADGTMPKAQVLQKRG